MQTLENGSNDEETIYRLFAGYGNLVSFINSLSGLTDRSQLSRHARSLDKANVGALQEIVDVVSITQQPERIKELTAAFKLYL